MESAIQVELAQPKKKGGRPRKYATEEERRQARIEYSRRAYWRKKNAEQGIEIDESIAPQRACFETDEERKEARKVQNLRAYYAHHEERLFLRAVSYQRCKV